MKNLEEEQRMMRDRLAGSKPKRTSVKRRVNTGDEGIPEQLDLKSLSKRIAELEAENASLKLQLAGLRDQPRRPARESDLSDEERRHLFMKYSNVRRY